MPQILDIGTINLDFTSGALLNVFVAAEVREAPVLGNDDLLASGELVPEFIISEAQNDCLMVLHGPAKGFDSCRDI